MLRISSALSALALLAACSASAGTPAPQAVLAEAPPAISESVSVADLAGAPKLAAAPAPDVAPQRAQRAPAERAELRRVSCDIRTRRTSNGLLIEAVARADETLSGDYELVIRASGGGNASDLTQAGPFTAGHGRFVTLGQSEITFERGARLDATLTLRAENGETCRRDVRL